MDLQPHQRICSTEVLTGTVCSKHHWCTFRTETVNKSSCTSASQEKSTLSLNKADPESSYSSIQHHYSIILSSILLVCFHTGKVTSFYLQVPQPGRAPRQKEGTALCVGLILQCSDPRESWRQCSSWLQPARMEEVAGWGQSLANVVIWSFV